jgi:hypothetical protein
MKRCIDLRAKRNHIIKTYSRIAAKSGVDDSMHTYGSRVFASAQRMLSCLVLAMTVAVPCGKLLAANPEPVELGTAATFGALAGGAISGTGHVKGAVGSGTGAIAPAITSTGTIYPTGHAVVMTALADFATAYNEGKTRAHDVLLSAAAYELGGTTLTPGVYKIGAAATLASPVTLNAEGDPDAVFIIQIAGALGATASVGNVILANDAQSGNVFWIVEGAVSMGASTSHGGKYTRRCCDHIWCRHHNKRSSAGWFGCRHRRIIHDYNFSACGSFRRGRPDLVRLERQRHSGCG